MKFAAKFVSWVQESDGSFSWAYGFQRLGRVHPVNGLWRTAWRGERDAPERTLLEEFECARDACLAAEKHWPPSDEYFGGWLQSKNGGYFRQFAKGRRVYVRQGDLGWYAVQPDGKVLGKGDGMVWFSSGLDAAVAVQNKWHTAVDADPFRDRSNDWRWLKLKNTARAA